MKPLITILCLAAIAGCVEVQRPDIEAKAFDESKVLKYESSDPLELSDLPVMLEPEVPIAVWNGVEWLPLNVDATDGSRLDIRLLTLSDQGAHVETLEQWSKASGKWNFSKRKEPPHHEQ